jgi:hypothetical protein
VKRWIVRWESRRRSSRGGVATRQERYEGDYDSCLRKMDKLVCLGVVETATMKEA